jgi:hypothetical protein
LCYRDKKVVGVFVRFRAPLHLMRQNLKQFHRLFVIQVTILQETTVIDFGGELANFT